MKKTLLIVSIGVLGIVAICLMVLIALTPAPVEPAPIDIYTPNSLPIALGIERPNKTLERLIALKTYQEKEVLLDDLLTISQIGGLEYYELDPESNDYLLITPFEIKGTLELQSLAYNEVAEIYEPQQIIFKANNGEELPDNYSLLIKYSRPKEPEYRVKLIQGDQVASYHIINTEDGEPVKMVQFVKDDKNPGTESIGASIIIPEEQI